METVTKKQLRLAVKQFGGKLETEAEGRFITYQVEAPRGHHWADGSGAHSLVVTAGFANVDNDARADALNRVRCGVEPCGPECDYWETYD